MKASDVQFITNSGDHKGTKYNFTLAEQNGQKAWQVTRLFQPAPAMAKEKIELMIAVREQNIPLSGGVELEQANKILDQLEVIAKETTPVTLVGLDNQERLVRVDRGGFSLAPTIFEKGREPEYAVSITCWSIYK